MTLDELERLTLDNTKRIQQLENAADMRKRATPHLSPGGPPLRYSSLEGDKERPGHALGVVRLAEQSKRLADAMNARLEGDDVDDGA